MSTAPDLSPLQDVLTYDELRVLMNHTPFVDAALISLDGACKAASRRLGRRIVVNSISVSVRSTKTTVQK